MRSLTCLLVLASCLVGVWTAPYDTSTGGSGGCKTNTCGKRAKAGPGGLPPSDKSRIPVTATRGVAKDQISQWNGMTLKTLTTAITWLNSSYITCAKMVGLTPDQGPAIVVGGNAVRFYQADPLITINFNINEVTFYQHKSSFATTGNIGRNIDRLMQNLCKDDKDGYVAAVDYLGQLHHKFAIDPTIKQNTDLGLFLKDADAHVRAIAACISHDQWTNDIYVAIMQPLRYIRWSTWHAGQAYSLQRNCFRRADPNDGARVKD
ncbi:uncharacterized protein LOC129581298 [Paramacrobiotus metropolitanus]|uniref:uncharacterized protein LOC129581298 n=1 Tax=Paramacrobiotus metropolitanus TaxID=2943436 RepID=UPI00244630AD|nr:uncharacterized protein LOC129581298 [Paramacrobiotus metropolitanus]